jgi:hypothetical protein
MGSAPGSVLPTTFLGANCYEEFGLSNLTSCLVTSCKYDKGREGRREGWRDGGMEGERERGEEGEMRICLKRERYIFLPGRGRPRCSLLIKATYSHLSFGLKYNRQL